MDQACWKLQGLATRHRGVLPFASLCSGWTKMAHGYLMKAIDRKGPFHAAMDTSLEIGSVLMGARSKMELARLSR